MGCFWPTRWCWRVAGQLAHRCCQCPWRGLHSERPASAPDCMGPHIDCWGMARHGVAGRWALTRAARWSSLPRYDLALDQQHHLPGSSDWYLDEMEGFCLAGLLQGDWKARRRMKIRLIKQNTRTLETIQFKNVNYESKYLLTEQNLMNSFQCDLG